MGDLDGFGPGDAAASDTVQRALRTGHVMMQRNAIRAALAASGYDGHPEHMSATSWRRSMRQRSSAVL